MKAIRLKTQFMFEPVGIDLQRPLLSWNAEGGKTQTAYELVAETDGKQVWTSGVVNSSSMRAEYPQKLVSRQRVTWKVRLYDETNTAGEWAESAFEMGLLNASDWSAKWITGNYKVDKKRRYPVDCFKKQFKAENVVKARLYMTACGIYEVKLNGVKAGEFCLAPGHTDYTKRIQYQTADVTSLVKNGENVLTCELADGWYRGSCGAFGLLNQYGTETKLLLQLELYTKDGSISRVVSDGTWAWSNDGPFSFADNKDGEIFDARKKLSYKGTAKVTSCPVVPTAANNVPLKEHERLSVK